MAQLLQYNCYATYRERAATYRETQFAVFMVISVYAKTTKRFLVEMLHEHGLSIPYDAAVSKYMEEGVVCPAVMRKGLLTTAAMDHFYHNPTATTATAALSDNGNLHGSLETHFTPPDTEPETSAIILDGSALINALPPRISKTFEEYAVLEVVPQVHAYSCTYIRTDIVFHIYWSPSLKAETRSKRGIGSRRRVTDKGKIPQNWRSFLRDNSNKTDLHFYLTFWQINL